MSVYESAEWRALVAAVVAAPDDDLPRLVAADFLEERDPDDRLAAAIRFEVGPSGWGREAHGWVFRAGEPLPAPVFDSHLATIDQLGDLAWPEGTRFTFRRGFVESVSCPAAAWLAHGDDILKQHPVRRVLLTDRPGPGAFGWDYSGVWANASRVPTIPWEAGEFPPHDYETAMRRYFAGHWLGVEFELPPGELEVRRLHTNIPFPPELLGDDVLGDEFARRVRDALSREIDMIAHPRVVGWNDPRAAAAWMAPDPADD